jgi:hypothetical protein
MLGDERSAAAIATAILYSGKKPDNDQLEMTYSWFLTKIMGLRIKVGPVTYQQGGSGSRPTTLTKDGFRMKDTEQVHATIEFDDTKGFATPDLDQVDWVVDDPSVATAQPDNDGSGGCMFVAGSPGSTLGRMTAGNITGSVAIDVTTGDAVSAKITLGDPEPQPSA